MWKESSVLHTNDIAEMLGFGTTKTRALIRTGVLPTIKIGKSYVTTKELMLKWIEENQGREVAIS